MKALSAAEANRHFSSLLREVAQGETVTVLSHGKPVATMAPIAVTGADKHQAKQTLLDRLRRQQPHGERTWTRDELYD